MCWSPWKGTCPSEGGPDEASRRGCLCVVYGELQLQDWVVTFWNIFPYPKRMCLLILSQRRTSIPVDCLVFWKQHFPPLGCFSTLTLRKAESCQLCVALEWDRVLEQVWAIAQPALPADTHPDGGTGNDQRCSMTIAQISRPHGPIVS